jgi:hypothetical protein
MFAVIAFPYAKGKADLLQIIDAPDSLGVRAIPL